MIKRIVKMVFRIESCETFLHIFDSACEEIRKANGCHYLELVRDRDDPRIFFTISIWENDEALEEYRHSDLFGKTWVATKALFDEPPKAWSTDSLRMPG